MATCSRAVSKASLSQEGVELRVLIIDDCSPDETPEVARRLTEADARVEYRRHEQNEGLAATNNEGLEWAGDGDYVVGAIRR